MISCPACMVHGSSTLLWIGHCYSMISIDLVPEAEVRRDKAAPTAETDR